MSVIKLYLKYLTGILPFCEIQEESIQFPILSEGFIKMIGDENGHGGLRYHIKTNVIRLMLLTGKPLF
jgi:hypothetical protein